MRCYMRLNHLPGLVKPLLITAESLNRAEPVWLLGGSCSLLLQGVKLDKSPRDIDIYTDTGGISELHKTLDIWAKDTPQLDEEGMYQSVLSHYEIEGYSVELVGGFTVTSHHSTYHVEVEHLLYDRGPENRLQDVSFRLMPLSHELVFNVLRGREDRYVAIADVIRQQAEHHVELLKLIISHNVWSQDHLTMIHRLTGITL